MASIGFILTEKCNWSCEYCEFPLKKIQNHSTIEIMKNHIPYIKKIMNQLEDNNALGTIFIDGGEVGLLNREVLYYFLSELDRKVIVSTNGTFLERGYHQDEVLKRYIDQVWYHVNTNGVTKYENKNIVYGLVHNNIDEIVEFVKNHPEILFNYIELEFSINKPRDVNYNLYKNLHERIFDIKNITPEAKSIIYNRINENPGIRKSCSELNTTVEIDMVNEKIILCQRSLSPNIPLKEMYLIRRLTEFPRDLFRGENKCNSCTRLFKGKFMDSKFYDYFKTRRIWKV